VDNYLKRLVVESVCKKKFVLSKVQSYCNIPFSKGKYLPWNFSLASLPEQASGEELVDTVVSN